MNPKDEIGRNKVSTWVIPVAALWHCALALMDGARKYNPFNWREKPITTSLYLDAMDRHLKLYAAGQQNASDSKVHHLGHVMGGCAILIDAELHKTLIDDRKHSPETVELLERLNKECLENQRVFDEAKLTQAQAKAQNPFGGALQQLQDRAGYEQARQGIYGHQHIKNILAQEISDMDVRRVPRMIDVC